MALTLDGGVSQRLPAELVGVWQTEDNLRTAVQLHDRTGLDAFPLFSAGASCHSGAK